MSYIIIKGSSSYIGKMYKHLRQEHPSTRKRMKAILGSSLRHLIHELKEHHR